MKKIVIESCDQCPKFRNRLESNSGSALCLFMRKPLIEFKEGGWVFPDWCPLEDEEK